MALALQRKRALNDYKGISEKETKEKREAILFCRRAFQEQKALVGLSGSARLAIPAPRPGILALSLPELACQVPYFRYLRYSPYSVAPRTPATPNLSGYGAEAARHPLPPPIAALALRYRTSNLDSSLWSNWCLSNSRSPTYGLESCWKSKTSSPARASVS